MKKIIYFIFAAMLVFVVSCNKDEVVIENETALDPRVFTIEAEMPDISAPGTRMTFDYLDGGLNTNNMIQFKWETTDVIKLAFKQGTVVKTGVNAEITNIIQNGKICQFTFQVPENFGIDFTQAYTVYGIVGGATFNTSSTTFTMDNSVGTDVFNLNPNKQNIVLGFTKEMPDGGTAIGRNMFSHVGTFLLINISNYSPVLPLTLQEIKLESRDVPKKKWFYGGKVQYDMATSLVVNPETYAMHTATFKLAAPVTLAAKVAGQDAKRQEFWQWVIPMKEVAAENRALVQVAYTYNSQPQTSELTQPVNLLPGRYYRINKNWDQSLAGLYYMQFCTNKEGTNSPGNVVKLKGVATAGGSWFIDLDKDGLNDAGDITPTTGGNYDLPLPIYTGDKYCYFLFGEITGIDIGGNKANHIVSAITNNPYIKRLNLSSNYFTLQAIKDLLVSLPDRTDFPTDPGTINLRDNTPALTINNTTGLLTGTDPLVAEINALLTAKNWKLSDASNYSIYN